MSFDERCFNSLYIAVRYFDIKGCNISSCEDSDKTARVQPNLIQLEYLWVLLLLRFSYLYALVYGDINLFCLMFAYFILLCN